MSAPSRPAGRHLLPRAVTITAVYPELRLVSLKTAGTAVSSSLGASALTPPPANYYHVRDDILETLAAYDFSVEHDAVAEYRRLKTQLAQEASQQNEQKKQDQAVHDEQVAAEKEATEKEVSPRVGATVADSAHVSNQGTGSAAATVAEPLTDVMQAKPALLSNTSKPTSGSSGNIDFREFEQGLAPPDPWDNAVDEREMDFRMLREVMGGGGGSGSGGGSHYGQTPPPKASGHPPHQPQEHSTRSSLLMTAMPLGSSSTYAPHVDERSPASAKVAYGGANEHQNTQAQAPLASFEAMRLGQSQSQGSTSNSHPASRPSIPAHLRPPVSLSSLVSSHPPQIPTRLPQRHASPALPPPPPKPIRFSTQAQNSLYEDITQMGFNPDTVAYGITKYYASVDTITLSQSGHREEAHKQILDFLISVNDLSRNVNPQSEDAPSSEAIPMEVLLMAVDVYPGDMSKQVLFARAFVVIAELGFLEKDIRYALEAKNCNRELAIEYLMGGGEST
ncbi:hypothetical protein BASA50_008470 [Batrachochytrium salamandrivorans]|uniref:UBA domain-containing protein n=1 Tax=Batrachochytrium salamandrivorans TaxID=1357716 RepID=A0ABQ8F4N6_9FUNG|nr:hypothetical protein BASA62_001664 [Batrachochytrium salamandrivorans]KAH6588501.1 hypothetical protein BASA61_005897 [Batrachochytrium salamandrivorans]KAH6591870.1 hypothetical protein BASA50_008470 [Batrachochytrium salamandrivorans]KAJ1340842.1 hypothetical protein BSLG_004544 [Batrachochytrium salamandrivorans]